MKVKQTLLTLGVLLGVFGGSLVFSSVALAANCGNAQTAIVECGTDVGTSVETNPIWRLLIIVLNIMLAGVGILAVAGVVYAAVLYATAADRAEQVKKAKDLILNVAK